jgi:hypothetical protein
LSDVEIDAAITDTNTASGAFQRIAFMVLPS